jgi:hypothetical protein
MHCEQLDLPANYGSKHIISSLLAQCDFSGFHDSDTPNRFRLSAIVIVA